VAQCGGRPWGCAPPSCRPGPALPRFSVGLSPATCPTSRTEAGNEERAPAGVVLAAGARKVSREPIRVRGWQGALACHLKSSAIKLVPGVRVFRTFSGSASLFMQAKQPRRPSIGRRRGCTQGEGRSLFWAALPPSHR
jgi:hypothetical protein